MELAVIKPEPGLASKVKLAKLASKQLLFCCCFFLYSGCSFSGGQNTNLKSLVFPKHKHLFHTKIQDLSRHLFELMLFDCVSWLKNIVKG